MSALTVLIDAETLRQHLSSRNLLIIDLSSEENYGNGHIAGAIRLDPARLLQGQGPVPNKLPTQQQLSQLFAELGLTSDTHVIAYDDQMGALAGRLIWTLDIVGHPHSSVLNGQRAAWINAGLPLETCINQPQPSCFEARIDTTLLADKAYLLAHLNDADCVIWDARSAAEYCGEKRINAIKGGHIPGAINFEWSQSLCSATDWRLRDHDALRSQLARLGISTDKTVITHCQTHRRSGLTYLVAKALGYPRIRCYDGSWFEWGNDPDTPVETD